MSANPRAGTTKRDSQGKLKAPAKRLGEANTELHSTLSLRGLRRDELPVDTTELARFLVGKILVRDVRRGSAVARMAGRIVETEAYPIGDAAGHHFRGETPRTRVMFGPHGYAYVFFNYGSAWMMNVTSEIPGVGGGILIRALEPLEGIKRMMRNRGVTRLLDVARGPGRLAHAMQIDRRLDGVDLCTGGGPLWLAEDGVPPRPMGVTTRIGLSREAHRKLRFYERGSLFVSGPKNLLKGFRKVRTEKGRGARSREIQLNSANFWTTTGKSRSNFVEIPAT